ncbi:hypothetical protein [Enterobacter hormaechei]|uniref:hypothetical protein n=1 Tax=Enterobacter hormaechei TaxID=158836 RepID=UPI0026EB6894|nr:hypothetical protein [Enterobacter hormaechei]
MVHEKYISPPVKACIAMMSSLPYVLHILLITNIKNGMTTDFALDSLSYITALGYVSLCTMLTYMAIDHYIKAWCDAKTINALIGMCSFGIIWALMKIVLLAYERTGMNLPETQYVMCNAILYLNGLGVIVGLYICSRQRND